MAIKYIYIFIKVYIVILYFQSISFFARLWWNEIRGGLLNHTIIMLMRSSKQHTWGYIMFWKHFWWPLKRVQPNGIDKRVVCNKMPNAPTTNLFLFMIHKQRSQADLAVSQQGGTFYPRFRESDHVETCLCVQGRPFIALRQRGLLVHV